MSDDFKVPNYEDRPWGTVFTQDFFMANMADNTLSRDAQKVQWRQMSQTCVAKWYHEYPGWHTLPKDHGIWHCKW